MNDKIRALIFEVCNDWVSRGNLYTDDIHECFLNSTGDKGKYSFALDALAKMALAAAPVPQAPCVPDGWKLVPKMPTPMMQSAFDCAPFDEDIDAEFCLAYRAMLAAAPQPRSPSAEERGDGINRARELMKRSAGDEREGV